MSYALLFRVLMMLMCPVFVIAQESPPPESAKPSTPGQRRLTNFEWDQIAGAKAYEIEIAPIGWNNETKEPYKFTVAKNSWNGNLKPGEYTMRLRSLDRRGVPGEWSKVEKFYVRLDAPQAIAPEPNQQIQTESSDIVEITFKWANQVDASKYRLIIEDESKSIKQSIDTQINEIAVKLPVARRYTWSLVGYDKLGNEAESFGPPLSFTLFGATLSLPRIETPESIYVRELSWLAVPHAEKYRYTLARRGSKRKWFKVKEGDHPTNKPLIFEPQWKGGEYKFSVSAYANLRANSKEHSIIFEVANGNRSKAAETRAQMRKSIMRTTGWYFIASYLITQITYSAENFDRGTSPRTQVLGGTGRLGAGYLDEKTPFGFLGIADLSGFFIGDKNYTYPSFEGHGIYRMQMGSLGEFRFSGGGYYKEIPEVLGDASTLSYSLSQISAFGIHTGGEYWFSINPKIGLQMNARVYYPLTGKTPNGNKLVPGPSYQVGFLGSLRLNPRATGLVGYAYRTDKLEYEVSNQAAISAGQTKNSTSVIGHYLNFFLEWDI